MRTLSLFPFLLFLILIQPSSYALPFESVIWTQLTPEDSPLPRFHHAMAYDSDQDKVIMIGGNVGGSGEQITWVYDYLSNTWIDRDAKNPPPGLNYHSMVYDSVNKKTILFGGIDFATSIPTDVTYAYDYFTNNWTKMSPANSPAFKRSPGMAFDEINARIVLFGGVTFQEGGGFDPDDDTWVYDYVTDNWTEIFTEVNPTPRHVPAMIYLPGYEEILLYGGTGATDVDLVNPYHCCYGDDTWIFDLQIDEWILINNSAFPERGETDLVYDQSIDRVLLYGGVNETLFDLDRSYADLWAYDPSFRTWELIDGHSAGPGEYRTEQSMVYNSEHNITIFYGGAINQGESDLRYGGTWSLKFKQPEPTTTTTDTITETSTTTPTTPTLTTSITESATSPTDSVTSIDTNTASTPIQTVWMVAILLTSLIKRRRRRR